MRIVHMNIVTGEAITDQSYIVETITLGEVLAVLTPLLPPGGYDIQISRHPSDDTIVRIKWEHPDPGSPSAPGLFVDNMTLGYVSSVPKSDDQLTIRVRLIS